MDGLEEGEAHASPTITGADLHSILMRKARFNSLYLSDHHARLYELMVRLETDCRAARAEKNVMTLPFADLEHFSAEDFRLPVFIKFGSFQKSSQQWKGFRKVFFVEASAVVETDREVYRNFGAMCDRIRQASGEGHHGPVEEYSIRRV